MKPSWGKECVRARVRTCEMTGTFSEQHRTQNGADEGECPRELASSPRLQGRKDSASCVMGEAPRRGRFAQRLEGREARGRAD